MARQKAQVETNFHVLGLITEAGKLTFPPNASVFEKNFVLHPTGKRERRPGMSLVGNTIFTGVGNGQAEV